MTDLPQHAAQVATWLRWDDGTFPYAEYLWLNWRTSYLVMYLVAEWLSLLVPVATALKLVVSAALLGIPLATSDLLARTGGRREWALATMPVGYGLAFYMGFVAFVVAAPLALAFVGIA